MAITYLVRPTNPTLIPGSGSNDSVSPSGSGRTAIARVNVVPFDTYTAARKVGVVAFHIHGIDRVTAQANGGDIQTVYSMALNSTSATIEYYFTLATKATDGVVNVQFVIYPTSGATRILTLQLYSNANATAPTNVKYVATDGNDTTGDGTNGTPYATIMKAANALQVTNGTGNADGGTIYLKTGSHVLGTYSFGLLTTTVDRWLTIRPAPGLTKANVTITGTASSDGIRTKLVRFYDVKVTGQLTSTSGQGYLLWTDNVLVDLGDRNVRQTWHGGFTSGYATDSTVTNSQNGFSGMELVRGCTVLTIGEIAYQTAGLVVNCTAEDIDGTGGPVSPNEFHPDVYQFFGNSGNVILYGVSATVGIKAQGFFCGDNITLENAAIVDCTITNTVSGVGRTFSFGGPTTHLYVLDSAFVGPNCTWAVAPDANFVGTDVVVENSTFNDALEAAAGVTVR